MLRRDFLMGLSGLAAMHPAVSVAQTRDAKQLRVGSATVTPRSAPFIIAFERRMAELGYQDGVNFIFDFLQVPSIDRFGAAYQEMAVRGVDIFIAGGNHYSVDAARAAAPQKPVVIVAIDYDPIARGYAESLSRPGGVVTGLFFQQIDLMLKRLDLLRSTFPARKNVGLFWDSISSDQGKAAEAAATGLGLRLFTVEVTGKPYDYEAAFNRLPPEYRETLILPASPFFLADSVKLADLARRYNTATICPFPEYVEAGGLFSYGPRFAPLYRRAAEYVDRIAKGAKPADLPIEQPTAFELVINLETARRIGLIIPPSFLARASEVIE